MLTYALASATYGLYMLTYTLASPTYALYMLTYTFASLTYAFAASVSVVSGCSGDAVCADVE